MKKTATIYSLFLVAGTAMAVSTMQQPRVERHQITNNQLWQNQRAIGDDACEDAGIFSNDAYPLTQSCSNAIYLGAINPSVPLDIDGDGVRDSIAGRAYYDKLMFNEIMTLLQKDGAASFRAVTLLDLESITYEGYEEDQIYKAHAFGFLDMNDDGLLDVIVDTNMGFFYIENISTPPAATCESDLNGDGSVEVNDLMQVISNWGPCE